MKEKTFSIIFKGLPLKLIIFFFFDGESPTLIKTMITNAENLRQHKSRFYLITEQILAFASTNNLVREVKNVSTTSKGVP